MAIQIEIKKTGFPVKIGEVELWFNASLENLRRFVNIDELAKKKLSEVQKKVKLPDEIDTNNLDKKTVDAALDLHKEFIAIQYDLIFGEGTFKKLYKKYPDISALKEALDVAGIAIAERIKSQKYSI